jgi:hypothetical protein
LKGTEHDQLDASSSNGACYDEATDKETAYCIDNTVANNVCDGSGDD